jgi:hypothetical protein
MATENTNPSYEKKINKYSMIISASSLAGLGLGLFFAHKRKSKVGGYIGWGLLGSAILGGVAFAIYGKKMVNATISELDKGNTALGMKLDNQKK